MNKLNKNSVIGNFFALVIFLSTIACGGGGSGGNDGGDNDGGNVDPITDTTPDAFTFIDQIDVELGSVVQSESITISGINAATPISISGGDYSINNGEFTNENGTITNGQNIVVQQIASTDSKTTTDVVLTIGGISDTFSTTTILVLNADYVQKAQSISLNSLNLYQGHVEIENPEIISLSVDNLQSGDLITIDIEFDAESEVDEYAFAFQLVPTSLVIQLDEGNTMGEVVKQDHLANNGEESISLGSILVEEINHGKTNHAVLHTKLPALAQDIDYQVIVSADINFLASGKEPQLEELALSPILIDEQILKISRLDSVLVKVIDPPKLLEKNEFTHLEIEGNFGANGYSVRPIFETSIEVDVTSFNQSERIELSMNWLTSKGDTVALGLISSDDVGNPMINDKAIFKIARNGGSSISVPVVAYVTEAGQSEMLAFATSIRDIADKDPESGRFVLNINYIENGNSVDTGTSYEFDLPLVSQDLRAIKLADTDIINFAVLRAGTLTNACLTLPLGALDIDSGFLAVDSVNDVVPEKCENPGLPGKRKLWRYDVSTKQFIIQSKDIEGNNYCLTAIDDSVFAPKDASNRTPIPFGDFREIRLERCEFDVSTPFSPVAPGTAIHTQRFELVENKVKLIMNNHFLNVRDDLFAPFAPIDVELIVDETTSSDFFRDTDGLDLDENGRVYNTSDSSIKIAGIEDIAALKLSYSGDAYVDYKPVAGMTVEGKAGLSLNLFGEEITLVGASFTHKRYLSKQLTSLAGNIYPVSVGNGSLAKFTLLGLESTRGEIVTSEIDQSYNPAENLNTYLQELVDEVNDIGTVDLGNDNFDEELFSIPTSIAGIPFTITGSVEGDLSLKGSLNQQGFGLNADLESKMAISAVLTAELNLGIAKPGVEGTIEIISKRLTFDSGAEFKAVEPAIALRPQINFDVHSSLTFDLKALKGDVVAFVKYRSLNFFSDDFMKIVRREKTLYSSGYLLELPKPITLFNGEISAQVIDI